MGSFQFQATEELLCNSSLDRAYLTGVEGLPWRTQIQPVTGGFVAERNIDETAILHFPWKSARIGDVMLCTSCLMHRDRPYDLLLELARGTVNRVRTFAADLQVAGFVLSSNAESMLNESTQIFIELLVGHADDADSNVRTIELALQAGEIVVQEYAQQAISHRKQQAPRLPTMLAAQIDELPTGNEEAALIAGFNTIALPFHWRQREQDPGQYDWSEIEQRVAWCTEQGLRVCAGPLVTLQRSSVPEWAYLWEGDFEQLLESAVQYVRQAVEKFRGKIQVWHAAAKLNKGGALDLTEDQRLRLCLATVEAIRQIDGETPVVVSVDQPWGEYLRQQNFSLSPFDYADALVRSDLGVAGIGLELNYGYADHGTYPRDWVAFSQQLDRWSMLGSPLMIELTAPSSQAADSQSTLDTKPLSIVPAEPDAQQWFVSHAVPIMLAKPFIHGVIWNQTLDRSTHDFPNGGLITADGTLSNTLQWLTQTRQEYLL
jgi:hypothetical protein